MTYQTYQHKSLQEADITLNGILDLVVEGVWDWDAKTGKVTRSPGWFKMLGYEINAFRKDVFTWENVIFPEDYQRVMTHFEDYISGRTQQYSIEYRCKTADGNYLWIIDRGKILARYPDGKVARMIGAHQNIHRYKMAQLIILEQEKLLKAGNLNLEKVINEKAEELATKNALLEKKIAEVESLSNIDTLTRIANRKNFEESLHKEILRANRYNHPLSLALFDIDLFKEINDKYGHKTGDTILCQITKLVSKNIRDVDLLARWGGDEFVIIFPEQNKAQAHISCEKLRTLIRSKPINNNIAVTCSFGVAQYKQNDNIDSLFQRVDDLLYQSKENGRNNVKSE